MDCAGHGTHVSGIIAASGPNIFNISGVASEANLYLYRIFGCDGFTTDDGKLYHFWGIFFLFNRLLNSDHCWPSSWCRRQR